MHWLNQEWTIGVLALPLWQWLAIACLFGLFVGLMLWAILTVRAHEREARDISDEFEAATAAWESQPDDWYAAAPALAPPALILPPGMALPPTTGWEGFSERLDRAEDALIAASDPAAFGAWLDADWDAYEADVASLDAVLASEAWASIPWARQRALEAAQ